MILTFIILGFDSCSSSKSNALIESKVEEVFIQEFIPGEEGQSSIYEINFSCENLLLVSKIYYKNLVAIPAKQKGNNTLCKNKLLENKMKVPKIILEALSKNYIILESKNAKKVQYQYIKNYKTYPPIHLPTKNPNE